LQPGVAFCLRRFQPLVQHLARARWMSHIRTNRRNISLLGGASDLEQFLFETSRQALRVVGEGLKKLTGPRCFYCDGMVDEIDVDHFVPFSLYPRDLAHNFVLAHPACNRSKSDALAAKPHLERWLAHVGTHSDDLREIGAAAGIVSDVRASRAVATWGYRSGLTAGSSAWLKSQAYETINASYMDCFA